MQERAEITCEAEADIQYPSLRCVHSEFPLTKMRLWNTSVVDFQECAAVVENHKRYLLGNRYGSDIDELPEEMLLKVSTNTLTFMLNKIFWLCLVPRLLRVCNESF
jgi:hypothetical protein